MEVAKFFGLPERPLREPPDTKRNPSVRTPWVDRIKRYVGRVPGTRQVARRSNTVRRIHRGVLEARGSGLSAVDRAWIGEYYQQEVDRLRLILGDEIAEWEDFRVE